MDADADIVFGASEVFRVGAGATAIAWALTRVPALVRIPVVAVIVISHNVIKSVTVIFSSWVVIDINIIYSSADSLIVHLNILFYCTGLIDGEDSVRQILAGEGEESFLIVLKKCYLSLNL